MQEKFITIDFETRSKADLSEIGARNYFLHPSTEILFIGYKVTGKDINIISFYNLDGSKKIKKVNIPLPVNLPIIAHNYKFEYYAFQKLIRENLLTDKQAEYYGNIINYRCTKATAQRYGLGSSGLDDLSEILINKKLTSGKYLIQKYSKPNRKGEFNLITHEDYRLWIDYLTNDILATEEIYNLLPKLHLDEHENKIFELDKIINQRGVNIDIDNVNLLLDNYKKLIEKTEQAAVFFGVETSGTLSLSSNSGLKKLFLKNGQVVNNVQADTLKDLREVYLNKESKTKKEEKEKSNILEIIRLRNIIQSKAPKKLFKFITLVDAKNLYYDILNYFGTQPTGRWAGYGVQVHNFPRVVTKDFDGDIERLTKGLYIEIKTMLRGLIIPRKGNIFLVGDFSSIELIVLAWLTKETKILDIIKAGKKVYTEFAKKIYNKQEINKESIEYQTGKTAVLGLGYGMGYVKFIAMAKLNNVILNDIQSNRIVKLYRNTFTKIPKFWADIERICINAITKKNTRYKYLQLEIVCKKINSILYLLITLPSGRVLYYYNPRLTSEGKIMIGQYGIWGGILTAHIVSSIARDILTDKLLECEAAGLNPVLTVHDEIINDIPIKDKVKKEKIFKKIMTTPPDWLKDFPLSADIGLMKRYGKL